MLAEFLSLNIYAFFLIFARVGTALSVAPGFSATYVSIRARLLMGLAISFVVTPLLATQLPAMPASPAGLLPMIAGEVVIGALLGTIARILISIAQVAGRVTSFVAALANAFILDPVSQQQSSLIANAFSAIALTLVFVTDLHHLMIRSWVDSYALFTPGESLMVADMADMVARKVSDAFNIGVQVAAPFLVVGIAYYLGLGLLSRLMPQMPVFFVGMPLQVLLQISVMAITLSGIMMVLLMHFADSLQGFVLP